MDDDYNEDEEMSEDEEESEEVDEVSAFLVNSQSVESVVLFVVLESRNKFVLIVGLFSSCVYKSQSCLLQTVRKFSCLNC